MLILDPPDITRGTGVPGVALPGSGLTIPTSILNTQYDARGIILNNREALEHYWIKKIDGLYDAEVRDNREVNSDRDGEQFLGNMYSGKPLIVEGVIRAHTLEKLLDMQYALTAAFDNIEEEFPFVGRTGDFTRDWVVYVAKTGQVGLVDSQDSYYFTREFQIPLRSSKPAIFSYREYGDSVSLPASIERVSATADVTNLGNRRGELRIVLSGQMQDVWITNNASGATFKFKDGEIVPDGRTWTIDTEEGTIFDDLGVNQFDAYEHTTDWLGLERSTAQGITVSATNTNASAGMSVFWRHTYK